jgi:hypothetical protein
MLRTDTGEARNLKPRAQISAVRSERGITRYDKAAFTRSASMARCLRPIFHNRVKSLIDSFRLWVLGKISHAIGPNQG